jgi:hypothetical protein
LNTAVSDPAKTALLDPALSARIWVERIVPAQRPTVWAALNTAGQPPLQLEGAAAFVIDGQGSFAWKGWDLKFHVKAPPPDGYDVLPATFDRAYQTSDTPELSQYPVISRGRRWVNAHGTLIVFPTGFPDAESLFNYSISWVSFDGNPVYFNATSVAFTEPQAALVGFDGLVVSFDGMPVLPPLAPPGVWEISDFRFLPEVFEVPYAGEVKLINRPATSTSPYYQAVDGSLNLTSFQDMLGLYASMEVRDETHWLVELPPDVHPQLLMTSAGLLAEGTGFNVRGNLMVLRLDPSRLWPERVVAAVSWRQSGPRARSHMLRADGLKSVGTSVTRYLRHNQSPGAFEEALREIAGLPDPQEQVRKLEPVAGEILVHLASGRTFLQRGSRLRVGDKVGRILRVRGQHEGEGWYLDYRGEIAASAIYPVWNSATFGRAPVAVERHGTGLLVDTGDDDLTRWIYQNDPQLVTYSGLEDGQRQDIDFLSILLQRYARRLLIVEADNAAFDPIVWKALRDFCLNHRPVASLIQIN